MPLTPALQRRGRQISTEFEAKETLSQKSNTINKKKKKKKQINDCKIILKCYSFCLTQPFNLKTMKSVHFK